MNSITPSRLNLVFMLFDLEGKISWPDLSTQEFPYHGGGFIWLSDAWPAPTSPLSASQIQVVCQGSGCENLAFNLMPH